LRKMRIVRSFGFFARVILNFIALLYLTL